MCLCYIDFFYFKNVLKLLFFKYRHFTIKKNHSLLIDDGVSAKPLTLSRSAVLRNAGNCS